MDIEYMVLFGPEKIDENSAGVKELAQEIERLSKISLDAYEYAKYKFGGDYDRYDKLVEEFYAESGIPNLNTPSADIFGDLDIFIPDLFPDIVPNAIKTWNSTAPHRAMENGEVIKVFNRGQQEEYVEALIALQYLGLLSKLGVH